MTPIAKQLLDAQQSGVYQLGRSTDEIERAAKDAGLTLFRIDLAQTHDKKSFLTQVAQALRFPKSFGHNWDALNDSLTDLESNAGFVLMFENGDSFCSKRNREFENAESVLSSAAEYWKGEGKPFWALFELSTTSQSDLPKWPTH
jgi:RNAse (barnase) inhibitor barstar